MNRKPKKVPTVQKPETIVQPIEKAPKPKTLGIALTPEAERILKRAYELMPETYDFAGMQIWNDKPTLTEFARIMLTTQCKQFIERITSQNKEGQNG